ncbi:hypothetical protein BD413DRAFT_607315 [Trametes elegans]|nr:hypothetical protein BD413DRAFT_607315 [Trametes elegans]
MSSPSGGAVDLLILGAGWTSTFLIPLCTARGLSHAATSCAGRDGTIAFAFDPRSDDPAPFQTLPHARTVLITFPIRVPGASQRLVRLYQQTHPGGPKTAFIQLGSTGIWEAGPTLRPESHVWTDRHSKIDEKSERAAAESELLSLAPETPTTVLNLAGLWGGQRQFKNWVPRVATSKDILKRKGSVHMLHGLDVSRAVLAVHEHFDRAYGQRWLVTDMRVYDWGEHAHWVRELIQEESIRALPRAPELLGRGMDSREFWNTFELEPEKNRLGEE